MKFFTALKWISFALPISSVLATDDVRPMNAGGVPYQLSNAIPDQPYKNLDFSQYGEYVVNEAFWKSEVKARTEARTVRDTNAILLFSANSVAL